jgi:S-adenosylmethionine:tRNA ribosyltransferase-isomerase
VSRSDRLSDFDYALPEALVAQRPAASRSASRLLVVTRDGLGDHRFRDLPSLLAPGDLCIVNDTRVIKARLVGQRETGGRIEALVDQVLDEHRAWVLLRASHLPRAGGKLVFEDANAVVVDRDDARPTADGAEATAPRTLPRFLLRFDCPVLDLLDACGRLPLPPYIRHEADVDDADRYQTVYATEPGAVAAPTAGLHFDEAVFGALAARGVEVARITLHVGAGTFLPVRTEQLDHHRMHAERYRIGADTAAAIAAARARGARIVAIGTTSLRALEASGGVAGDGETDLFIRPGYRFRVVDRLLTNLHLPRSTLLILVSAFAGTDRIRRAYAHAVAGRYRFFSYGDAMLLDRVVPVVDDGAPPPPGGNPRRC